jgi:hypothetical protein
MSPLNPGEFTDMDGKAIGEAGEPRSCPFCNSGAEQPIVERWSDAGMEPRSGQGLHKYAHK